MKRNPTAGMLLSCNSLNLFYDREVLKFCGFNGWVVGGAFRSFYISRGKKAMFNLLYLQASRYLYPNWDGVKQYRWSEKLSRATFAPSSSSNLATIPFESECIL